MKELNGIHRAAMSMRRKTTLKFVHVKQLSAGMVSRMEDVLRSQEGVHGVEVSGSPGAFGCGFTVDRLIHIFVRIDTDGVMYL